MLFENLILLRNTLWNDVVPGIWGLGLRPLPLAASPGVGSVPWFWPLYLSGIPFSRSPVIVMPVTSLCEPRKIRRPSDYWILPLERETHTDTCIFWQQSIVFSLNLLASYRTCCSHYVSTSWIILLHGVTLHLHLSFVNLLLLDELNHFIKLLNPLITSIISSLQLHLPVSVGLC